MQRVYLDQWVWVALARAFHEDKPSEDEVDAHVLEGLSCGARRHDISLRVQELPLDHRYCFTRSLREPQDLSQRHERIRVLVSGLVVVRASVKLRREGGAP